MDLDLGGKIAIVTGGAMGIGKGIVECLVREGAKVVIADLNDKEAEKVAKKLGENVIALKMDVTNKAEVENVVKMTLNKFGKIDILVSRFLEGL